MGLPVLAGGQPRALLELAHEVQLILIAAEKGQGGHGHVREAQLELRMLYPGAYEVLHTGGAEKLFIEMLKMGDA